MKEPLTLYRLRAALAILIALSLALTPVASAWAAMQMRADMKAATTTPPSDDAMIDCMKAMQGVVHASKSSKSCQCCDTQSKAACPDIAACLAKCGTTVMAVLVPEQGMCLNVVRHVQPADPEKPPDWAYRPPSPPPKA